MRRALALVLLVLYAGVSSAGWMLIRPSLTRSFGIGSLDDDSQTIAQAASRIYAAYIIAGRVEDGQEKLWMDRAIREAIRIGRIVDESIQSDGEFD